jgi:hypothetical protein
VPPTPVRLTHRALEGGLTAPSNAFSVLMQDHAVTSGQRDRPSPSLSTLCNHPRHCCTTPGTVTTSRCCWGTRGQDVATTATVSRTGLPSTTPSNRLTTTASQPTTTPLLCNPRSRSCTSTGRTRLLNQGRIRQDGRQLHDTARHTATCREIVRHACKSPSPWPIKGRAIPQSRGHGTTNINHSYVLCLPDDIGTRLNQYLWDLEATPPLPPRL